MLNMSAKQQKHTRDDNAVSSIEISDSTVLAKNPIVSVGMITYNHKPYIAQAIEGVLKQNTEYPFELIIGEDCSTDGTLEVVLVYQKQYPDIIRVIYSEENVGIRKNGKRTLALCRGKYVATCEGDDFWHHPGKLQMQVDYLEDHPECGLVHTDADQLIQKTGEMVSCWHKRYHKILQGDIYDEILLKNPIMTCTVCMRKACVDIYKQSPAVKMFFLMGDYPKWLFIAMNWNIDYLNVSTTTRRVLENSASKSTDTKKKYQFFISRHDVQKYFIELHPPKAVIIEAIQKKFHKKNLKFAYLMNNKTISEESYANLAENDALSLTDKLYYFGTRSKLCRQTAKLLFILKKHFRFRRMLLSPRVKAMLPADRSFQRKG